MNWIGILFLQDVPDDDDSGSVADSEGYNASSEAEGDTLHSDDIKESKFAMIVPKVYTYCSAVGKHPLLGKHLCTTFQWINVAASTVDCKMVVQLHELMGVTQM